MANTPQLNLIHGHLCARKKNAPLHSNTGACCWRSQSVYARYTGYITEWLSWSHGFRIYPVKSCVPECI